MTFIQANFEPLFFPPFDSNEDEKQVADTQGFGLVGLFRARSGRSTRAQQHHRRQAKRQDDQ